MAQWVRLFAEQPDELCDILEDMWRGSYSTKLSTDFPVHTMETPRQASLSYMSKCVTTNNNT